MTTEQTALIVTEAPSSVAALNAYLTSSDRWLVKHTCPMSSGRLAQEDEDDVEGGPEPEETPASCLVILERTIES